MESIISIIRDPRTRHAASCVARLRFYLPYCRLLVTGSLPYTADSLIEAVFTNL